MFLKNHSRSTIVETTGQMLLHNIDQAMDLIGHYGSQGARGLLIHENHLSVDFFNLRTGLAGEVLQKFANYKIKAAMVLDRENLQGRFGELAMELNRGGMIRIFHEPESAKAWLNQENY